MYNITLIISHIDVDSRQLLPMEHSMLSSHSLSLSSWGSPMVFSTHSHDPC